MTANLDVLSDNARELLLMVFHTRVFDHFDSQSDTVIFEMANHQTVYRQGKAVPMMRALDELIIFGFVRLSDQADCALTKQGHQALAALLDD